MSREIFLQEDSLITSKTDLKGKIVYANDDFLSMQVIPWVKF